MLRCAGVCSHCPQSCIGVFSSQLCLFRAEGWCRLRQRRRISSCGGEILGPPPNQTSPTELPRGYLIYNPSAESDPLLIGPKSRKSFFNLQPPILFTKKCGANEHGPLPDIFTHLPRDRENADIDLIFEKNSCRHRCPPKKSGRDGCRKQQVHHGSGRRHRPGPSLEFCVCGTPVRAVGGSWRWPHVPQGLGAS